MLSWHVSLFCISTVIYARRRCDSVWLSEHESLSLLAIHCTTERITNPNIYNAARIHILLSWPFRYPGLTWGGWSVVVLSGLAVALEAATGPYQNPAQKGQRGFVSGRNAWRKMREPQEWRTVPRSVARGVCRVQWHHFSSGGQDWWSETSVRWRIYSALPVLDR